MKVILDNQVSNVLEVDNKVYAWSFRENEARLWIGSNLSTLRVKYTIDKIKYNYLRGLHDLKDLTLNIKKLAKTDVKFVALINANTFYVKYFYLVDGKYHLSSEERFCYMCAGIPVDCKSKVILLNGTDSYSEINIPYESVTETYLEKSINSSKLEGKQRMDHVVELIFSYVLSDIKKDNMEDLVKFFVMPRDTNVNDLLLACLKHLEKRDIVEAYSFIVSTVKRGD